MGSPGEPEVHATALAVVTILKIPSRGAASRLNRTACTGEEVPCRARSFGLSDAAALVGTPKTKSPHYSPLDITCVNCAAIVDAALQEQDLRGFGDCCPKCGNGRELPGLVESASETILCQDPFHRFPRRSGS